MLTTTGECRYDNSVSFCCNTSPV